MFKFNKDQKKEIAIFILLSYSCVFVTATSFLFLNIGLKGLVAILMSVIANCLILYAAKKILFNKTEYFDLKQEDLRKIEKVKVMSKEKYEVAHKLIIEEINKRVS